MIRRLGAARSAALAAAVLMIGAAAHSTMIEPFRLTTTRVPLPEGPLSRVLAGERIVHLSDLHFRGYGLRERRLLAALREASPDLILMTGDYADTDEGVEALRKLFSGLRPRLGILAVPGNNDYYRGRQAEIREALRSAGVKLLINESLILEGRQGRFVVAGVDDPFFGRDETRAVSGRLPEELPAILLAHSPEVLQERARGMLFNAGDADGPWGHGSFWTHGSHFRDAQGPVTFTGAGPSRLRIQTREDGVGVERILLVPAGDSGASPGPMPRGLQGRGLAAPQAIAGTIEIDLCDPRNLLLQGTWTRVAGGESGCMLVDDPDEGVLESFPVSSPDSFAEAAFEPEPGRAYQVWVRLYSPTSSGKSDSIFIQWDNAVDGRGRPLDRIGETVPPAAGFDLVLAGHTHGGQVRIPWLGPLERSLTRGPFVMGRYDLEGTMLYVSRGIGTSYLPVRFACAPEIVVLSSPGGDPS